MIKWKRNHNCVIREGVDVNLPKPVPELAIVLYENMQPDPMEEIMQLFQRHGFFRSKSRKINKVLSSPAG